MPVTAKTAEQTIQSVADAEEVTIFDADLTATCPTQVTTMAVKCHTGVVAVRVLGMHPAGQGYRLEAGEREVFRFGKNGIRQVHVTGLAASTITWGAQVIDQS